LKVQSIAPVASAWPRIHSVVSSSGWVRSLSVMFRISRARNSGTLPPASRRRMTISWMVRSVFSVRSMACAIFADSIRNVVASMMPPGG
jgi:hypothetical protein